MRKCVVALWLMAIVYLGGCGLLAQGAGVSEYVDEDGIKRVRVQEDSLADRAQSILLGLGPWGVAAGAAVGIAKKVIRHREILAHGQKDDNWDGIPDDHQGGPKPPAVPPSTTA